MSRQNVELVRSIVANAQELAWDPVSAKLDEDVVLDASRFPDGGVYRGREAFRDFFRRWLGAWDDLHIVPERILDDGELVLVMIRIEGRGKGSGVPAVIRGADLWTVRDGRVVSFVAFTDRAEALRAAGLSE
jgi:ketosteroid isomerase-like protein